MLTLGDVFSVVAFLSAIAFCSWALLVALSLVFDQKVARAQDMIQGGPWRCLGAGLFWLVLGGGLGLVLANAPLPITKALGVGIILFLLGVMALGLAGLVGQMSDRVRALDPNVSEYAAISRGALFVVLPGFLPILGWIGIGPVLLVMGLGAGMKSMLKRRQVVIAEVA